MTDAILDRALSERIFNAWFEQMAAEDALMDRLLAAGLPEGWNDWWFDSYDTSIEFGQCIPDYRLPQSVLTELWAMGFSRCWVNHTDGMQTYYTPSGETRYSGSATRGKLPHKDELAAADERARALAEAARAEEREACAKACEALGNKEWSGDNFGIGKHAGCIECASLIRARGQAKADGSGA